jgi:2-polyprenyl-3-methyl-5-hydroxy-6-metoxy-1,4-benzoquinol methylase
MSGIITRVGQSIRWRLGLPVAAAELEKGTDEAVAGFYNSRVTGCEFLDDPAHYERPRATWVLEQVNGGDLLEIGCGNGGMTRLLAPKVENLMAFDVSKPSLAELDELGLPNVTTVCGLLETFDPGRQFESIVMSEVIEHLRDPLFAVKKAFEWVASGGTFFLTTPNGHWESDEHLHEFSLEGFSALLAQTGCESMETGYLRDVNNRRRWLTAVLRKAATDATPNDFFDRAATARKRKQRSK